MDLKRLLFLHANGFPAAVYRRFLQALQASIEVIPIAVLETPADTPGALRWRRMREQVGDALSAAGDDTGLVGHSMGGYLSLMAAAHRLPARHPVVLIDSPLPDFGRGALLSLAQRTGLNYRLGPAPVAARRRTTWPDRDEAKNFFAGKSFVQRWAPGVIDDFVAHALRDVTHSLRDVAPALREVAPALRDAAPELGDQTGNRGGNRGGIITLRIPREEERDIYAHLPHRDAARALRRLRSAGVPVGFVAGAHSQEMKMAGWRGNRRMFGKQMVVLDAGHLVPLEEPQACADAVLALLRWRHRSW
jgi:pimeloyl-ACP methyl ester carboxylesterase